MYCPSCGKPNPENASFCSTCGNRFVSVPQAPQPVSDIQAQQYQMQNAALRKGSIDSLYSAIAHFSQKSAIFEEYDYVCHQINRYSRGAKASLLIWGCIAVTLGLMFAVTGEDEAFAAVSIGLFVIPGILMIVGGILMKIFNKRTTRQLKERYAALTNELYNHFAVCPNCPVGTEYVNPRVLGLLLEIIQSGRADTVKESLNILMDKRRQAQVRKYLAVLGRNTADVNAMTHLSATFVPASLFL